MFAVPNNLQSAYVAELTTSNSNVCIISLSPRKKLGKNRLFTKYNCIRIADTRSRYYTVSAGKMVDAIARYVISHDIRTVCFFGASKAGFGALLWAHLAARKMPFVKVFALTFSPQTRLWPYDESLHIPTYRRLIERARWHIRVRLDLRRYGDVAKFPPANNLRAVVIYGDLHERDRSQALYLRDRCELAPLPIPIHGSIFPFSARPGRYEEFARRQFEAAKDDADLAATLPESPAVLVSMMKGLGPIPNLDALMDSVIGDEELGLPAVFGHRNHPVISQSITESSEPPPDNVGILAKIGRFGKILVGDTSPGPID